MEEKRIIVKETGPEDLDNIQKLWNNGAVMASVGFPEGLGICSMKLEAWLETLSRNRASRHYSIYESDIGYCGETWYGIDTDHSLAALDIKLMPEAQGLGIAAFALSYAIEEAFSDRSVSRVYVEPDPENSKAWTLYERLGFVSATRPDFLEPWDTYLELTREDWIEKKFIVGHKRSDDRA